MVIRNEAATRALTVPRLRPWRVRNTTDNCSGFRPPSGGSALIYFLSRYIILLPNLACPVSLGTLST